jgi:cell division protein ZipA
MFSTRHARAGIVVLRQASPGDIDMDISTFRWILVIAGIAIVAGIFLFGNPDRKRKPRASRKRVHAQRVRREPALNSERSETDESGDDYDARQAELAIDLPSEDRFDTAGHVDKRIEPRLDNRPNAPAIPLPDKIVTLFLQARDKHVITGIELLDASLKSGLVFGNHDIFHRIHEEDVEPVFSMANLTKPGSFDKNAWNTMEIQGVTMFMTLPGPRNALDAWDSMLATSRRLAELLHADLLDDKHQVFTRQRSMQIKEELREYERQKNPES